MEGLGKDGRMILMDLREIGWEVLDWIHISQKRDQLWAFMNTVIKLEFHKRQGVY
jgi:hypothetical protein